MLYAIHILHRSWWLIKPQTIQGWFQQCSDVDSAKIEVPTLEGIDLAVHRQIVTSDDSGECYGNKICAKVLSNMAGDHEDHSSESDVEEMKIKHQLVPLCTQLLLTFYQL